MFDNYEYEVGVALNNIRMRCRSQAGSRYCSCRYYNRKLNKCGLEGNPSEWTFELPKQWTVAEVNMASSLMSIGADEILKPCDGRINIMSKGEVIGTIQTSLFDQIDICRPVRLSNIELEHLMW